MLALNNVLQKIRQYETEFNRKENSVSLLAVSKTQSIEKIKQAYAFGQHRFGENYLQEALKKIDALKTLDIEWHFIGQIQSNKTKAIAEQFDWVQSVSSVKVAQRLNTQRPTHLSPLNICIQVNLSEEASKAGVHPAQLSELVNTVSQFDRLRLRGLMVIPKAETDFDAQVRVFEEANRLYESFIEKGLCFDTLSMGMTQDYPAAIKAGSTMVRLGSAIFGKRE